MADLDNLFEWRKLITYSNGELNHIKRQIIREMPLTIMLNGKELATLLCSPHSFELLALGFLVNSGILHSRSDLKDISYLPEQGIIRVDTINDSGRTDGFLRQVFSNCSGKRGLPIDFLYDNQQIPPISSTSQFTIKELLGYAALLNDKARTFKSTGGVHEAALAYQGNFITFYEDIGRHNALDRILGYTFINNIDASDKVIVLSGRIASEMLVKVVRISVPVVVSRSAPTCLSIDLAEELGITLIGFARGDNLNIYTHPERIILDTK